MDEGFVAAGNGDPEMAVSTPLLMFRVQPETLLEPLLAAYRNLPDGSTFSAAGPVPAVKGDPVTGVSAPVPLLMLYAEISPEVLLATYKNSPEGSVATEDGPDLAANGEPLTAVRLPFCKFTENADTLLEPEFTT